MPSLFSARNIGMIHRCSIRSSIRAILEHKSETITNYSAAIAGIFNADTGFMLQCVTVSMGRRGFAQKAGFGREPPHPFDVTKHCGCIGRKLHQLSLLQFRPSVFCCLGCCSQHSIYSGCFMFASHTTRELLKYVQAPCYVTQGGMMSVT